MAAAEDTKKEPLYKGTLPGKKVPRDVEIKNELRVLEYKHTTALRVLADTVSKVRREELHKMLGVHQQNHHVKNAKVATAAQSRDMAKKAADQAHQDAMRKAQSDHQKAINLATKTFEETRDALETAVALQNKPIHEAQQAKDADIIKQAEATVVQAAEDYEAACKPLVEELKALDTAALEKQKKRDAAKPKEAEQPAAPTT